MNEIMKAPPHELELYEPPPNAVFTIDATTQIVDVSRRTVIRYYKRGLVSPVLDPRFGFYFDRDGIRRLRRIEELRPLCQDVLASIKIILDLMDEVQRLRTKGISRKQSANGNSQSRSSTTKEKNDNERYCN